MKVFNDRIKEKILKSEATAAVSDESMKDNNKKTIESIEALKYPS